MATAGREKEKPRRSGASFESATQLRQAPRVSATLPRCHPPRQHGQAGLLAGISGIVAVVAVRLILRIRFEISVGLVLAVAPC